MVSIVSADSTLSLLWDSTRLRLLVERNGRTSQLTEAGRVLASHASQALATLAAGEEELHALAGLESGTIHIGASTTPGVYLLPDILGCFQRDHPNVSIEVEIASTGEIIERLLAGRRGGSTRAHPARPPPRRRRGRRTRCRALLEPPA